VNEMQKCKHKSISIKCIAQFYKNLKYNVIRVWE
jgi:hypothetical protein